MRGPSENVLDLAEVVGTPEPVTGKRKCIKCGHVRPVVLFPKGSSAYTSKQVCQVCTVDRRSADAKNGIHPPRLVSFEITDLHRKGNKIVSMLKKRAATLGVPFDITYSWVMDKLYHGRCEATGIDFEYSEGRRNPFSPSIDRTLGSLGYTIANCRMVVWSYNAAKNDFTHEDVVRMARGLVDKENGVPDPERRFVSRNAASTEVRTCRVCGVERRTFFFPVSIDGLRSNRCQLCTDAGRRKIKLGNYVLTERSKRTARIVRRARERREDTE